jgi:hypothetical protein
MAQKRFAYACAAAVLFVPLLFAPVRSVAQDIIKQLLSCTYQFSFLGTNHKGIVIMTDGETKELKMDNGLLKIKLESLDATAVKASVQIYRMDSAGNLKLYGAPKIITRKDTMAKICVSQDDHIIYSLALIPTDSVGEYRGKITEEKK